MAKQIHLLFFIIISMLDCYAQDVHFSQYFNAPMLINPALTANFKGSGRFILNYKNQWGSLTENPYKTFSFSYDRPVLKNSFFAGAQVVNDRAGDSEMGITKIALNIASKVKVQANDFLKLGIQGTWSQYSYKYDALTWNSQFNGSVIDPNLSSLENGSRESFNYIDFSTGMQWTHVFEIDKQFNFGFSAFHLTQPGYYSFLSYEDLYVRWVIHGDFSIPVAKQNLILEPSFLVMMQGPSREINVGLSAKYYYELDSRLIENQSYIAIGAYYRNQDALIITTRYNYKNQFDFNLSYDINLSDLYSVSRAKGGFEMALIYTLPEKSFHSIKH
jgi:type IX secretion system PorP/SprF family membrane protein